MRNFILFVSAMVVVNISLIGQTSPDKRLYECFNQDEINQIIQQNPALIDYYNFYLDHSYYSVTLSTSEKPVTGEDIHLVSARKSDNGSMTYFSEKTYNKEKFNPLLYNFNLKKDSYVIYIWKEANVAIVFYPLNIIESYYREFTNNKK